MGKWSFWIGDWPAKNVWLREVIEIYIYIDEENNEEVDGQVESKVHETYNSGIHKNNDASFCAHRTQKKNLGPSNFESILKSLTLHILNGNDIS